LTKNEIRPKTPAPIASRRGRVAATASSTAIALLIA
jgi:hypothetical protein